MLSSKAHTLAQQARLAITLAWVAGYTNVITILTCGTVTSHVSGTLSQWGRILFHGQWAGFATFLLTMFLAGAFISGLCTETGRRRGWESIYVLPMAIQAVLLTAFAIGVELHKVDEIEVGKGLYLMTGLASLAMGLQNATITRISNGVVRTTHMTGVFTDLGLESAQHVFRLLDRRKSAPEASLQATSAMSDARRLLLLLSVAGSFAVGAGLGAIAYERMPRWAMIPPVLFLIWIVYRDVRIPICEIEPMRKLKANYGTALPDSMAVFHLRKDRTRRGDVHRLPDLLSWCDRLPPSHRVVVLDLQAATALEANDALELSALIRQSASRGRRIIIAGLSREQYLDMCADNAVDAPETEHFCPDLDLAIARGMAMLDEE